MPRPLVRIPPTSYDADAIMGDRSRLRVGPHDVLTRRGSTIRLQYTPEGEPRNIVHYHASGDVRITPGDTWSYGEFRRICSVLPYNWSGIWRGPRRPPRLAFREVYTIVWATTTFHACGDASWGYGNRITRAELNAEADSREGVTVMTSRRRTPRVMPAWAVQTALAPEPDEPTGTALERAMRAFNPEFIASLRRTEVPDPEPIVHEYPGQHTSPHEHCEYDCVPNRAGEPHCMLCLLPMEWIPDGPVADAIPPIWRYGEYNLVNNTGGGG